MSLAPLVARARSLVSSLDEPERTDARRVVALVTSLDAVPVDPSDAANVRVRIELRGLAERLGRRSSEGVPFASMARAASARLVAASADAALIEGECDVQLATFGL